MTIIFKFWRYAVRLCTYCGRDWSNTPGSFVGCQPNCAARHKRLVNLLTSSLGYLTEVCIHVFAQNLDHDDTENDCRGTVVLQHLHTQSQVPVVRLTSQSLAEKIASLWDMECEKIYLLVILAVFFGCADSCEFMVGMRFRYLRLLWSPQNKNVPKRFCFSWKGYWH